MKDLDQIMGALADPLWRWSPGDAKETIEHLAELLRLSRAEVANLHGSLHAQVRQLKELNDRMELENEAAADHARLARDIRENEDKQGAPAEKPRIQGVDRGDRARGQR